MHTITQTAEQVRPQAVIPQPVHKELPDRPGALYYLCGLGFYLHFKLCSQRIYTDGPQSDIIVYRESYAWAVCFGLFKLSTQHL